MVRNWKKISPNQKMQFLLLAFFIIVTDVILF